MFVSVFMQTHQVEINQGLPKNLQSPQLQEVKLIFFGQTQSFEQLRPRNLALVFGRTTA